VVEALRQQLQRLEIARRTDATPFSSGCAGLDRTLPGRGLHRGTLVEYLAEAGSGAAALALIAGREACRDGGAMVVVDMHPRATARAAFYPPAAANLGVQLERLVLVRPRTQKDFRWALNQSLSCQGVGAVICWPERLDSKTFRQWQLAAENAGTVGLMIRPNGVRGQPSWSDLQLLVETLPVVPSAAAPATTARRLRVEIIRCRNGNPGSIVELELDDETGTLQESRTVCVASAMAIATAAKQASGA
jgi:protein ImuA